MANKAICVVLVSLALALAGYLAWPRSDARRPLPSATETELKPLPALSETPYLNASGSVKYVGRRVCAECHAAQHATYQRTAHSRALSDLDESAEPANGEFHHAASQRRYRVYREQGELRHQESFSDASGQVLASIDRAARYLIGSGAHSRSYLVEVDGFLVESPVTWYVGREQWDVSPGYDRATPWSFERATEIGCLFCHVGHVEPEGNALHKLSFHEQAIGCERCHGPGALHVEQRRASPPIDGDADYSIVHPGRLPRRLAEAICSQCHLRGEATVLVRGRKLTDYRPGLPLADIRVDYHRDGEPGDMKVVGHTEQMHLSRCYTMTETLTCTTCHDPHSDQEPVEKAAHYRAKCLECHQSADACGLPVEQRTTRGDNCVQCHMPQTPTDIPHIAFTHHRIGVHNQVSKPAEPAARPALRPHHDPTNISELDQSRNLGLAYLEFAAKQPTPESFRFYQERAVDLLLNVRNRGLADPAVETALARLAWQEGSPDAGRLADAALRLPSISTRARVNTMFIVADTALSEGRIGDAVTTLEQLTQLRRNSEDYFLLALCHARGERYDKAVEHIQRALQLNPFRADVHALAAELLSHEGKRVAAERHRRTADQLRAVAGPR